MREAEKLRKERERLELERKRKEEEIKKKSEELVKKARWAEDRAKRAEKDAENARKQRGDLKSLRATNMAPIQPSSLLTNLPLAAPPQAAIVQSRGPSTMDRSRNAVLEDIVNFDRNKLQQKRTSDVRDSLASVVEVTKTIKHLRKASIDGISNLLDDSLVKYRNIVEASDEEDSDDDWS
eukprot:TRINITY_DN6093_c0_g1_i1.p2 TRINITY_DN6093_c0_g1~~TRINITY_DN6093_c0_g1_i1.p2  ORF type:complete len:203 (-),score=47.83 TRINITY_DN6093_c0_g1_i1:75-614(-)